MSKERKNPQRQMKAYTDAPEDNLQANEIKKKIQLNLELSAVCFLVGKAKREIWKYGGRGGTELSPTVENTTLVHNEKHTVLAKSSKGMLPGSLCEGGGVWAGGRVWAGGGQPCPERCPLRDAGPALQPCLRPDRLSMARSSE